MHPPARAGAFFMCAAALPWYTHHRTAYSGRTDRLSRTAYSGAHRASQTASAHATGTEYHTHHRTAYSEPHRSTQHRLRLYNVEHPTGARCGSTMVHTPQRAHRSTQRASAMATGTMYHTHHRTASAGRKKLYTKYIKKYFATFFYPSKIAETFSRICK